MASGAARTVRDRLLSAGAPGNCPAAIVVAAETDREERRVGTLSDLEVMMAGSGGAAMLLLDWPKPHAVEHGLMKPPSVGMPSAPSVSARVA
jgi:hypothetical protein